MLIAKNKKKKKLYENRLMLKNIDIQGSDMPPALPVFTT